jgi:1,4-dihydroxy-2-naphthoate octaprenyltransferase
MSAHAPTDRPALIPELWTLVVHLRLPFQLLLAPLFLWGWVMAGGRDGGVFWLTFVAFHVFLYGGATAFNSAYDRDEGPVGGLEHPPPVSRALLPFSLVVQAIGWALVATVNLPLFALYGAFVLLSLAYSHPLVRLKGKPLGSLVTVAFGQGTLAFLAGWAAARGDLTAALSGWSLLAAVAATLTVAGLYPLTQIFQVEEDTARGDRTLAVAWGPRRCFLLALVGQTTGGLAMATAAGARFGLLDAVLVGGGTLIQTGLVALWMRHYDPSAILRNYRIAMRLNTGVAGAAALYLGTRALLGG